MGLFSNFWLMAQTNLESNPPLNKNPSGASASNLFLTPYTNLSWMFVQMVSRSEVITLSTLVTSK